MSAFPEVFGGIFGIFLLANLGTRSGLRRVQLSEAALVQERAAHSAALAERVPQLDALLVELTADHLEKLTEETAAMKQREELLMFQLSLAGGRAPPPRPSWRETVDEDDGPGAVA